MTLERMSRDIGMAWHNIVATWDTQHDWDTLVALVVLCKKLGYLRRIDIILPPGHLRDAVVKVAQSLKRGARLKLKGDTINADTDRQDA